MMQTGILYISLTRFLYNPPFDRMFMSLSAMMASLKRKMASTTAISHGMCGILIEPEDRRSRLRILPTSIVPHPRSSVVNAVEMAWTARSELKIIPIKLAPAVPRRYPVTLMIMIIPAVNSRFRFFFRQTRRIIAMVSTVRNSSSPIPASRHRMVTAA